MKFSQIVFLVSITTWVFPVIKQRNTDYFYFFFVLAMADPLRLLIYQLCGILPISYFPLFSFFLILSLSKKKYYLFISAAAVILTLMPNIFHWPNNIVYLITAINHTVLLLIFINTIAGNLIKKKTVNLFMILIIFYEIITVYKLAAYIVNLNKGGISFYLGTAIQIGFGILFSFINVRTKEFKLNQTGRKF